MSEDREAWRDDLREFGCSEEAIAEALGDAQRAAEGDQAHGQAFAVHPSNADALGVFLALGRKWRPEPMAGRVLGPDYPDVDVVIRRSRPKDEELVFFDYLAMEDAALKVLNKT